MKKSTVIIIWGLIIAIANSLFSLCMYFTGNLMFNELRYISFFIIFIGLLAGIFNYRNKALGGRASFAQLFKAGMFMTIVLSIGISLYFFIFLKAAPSSLVLINQTAQMRAASRVGTNVELSPEEKQEIIQSVNLWTSPLVMIAADFVANLFYGALSSLIVAAIAKKKKPLAP
jgi:hypothetical protein